MIESKRKRKLKRGLRKIGSVALEVLGFISTFVELEAGVFYEAQYYRNKFSRKKSTSSDIMNSIRSLRKAGYLEVRSKGQKYSVQLTRKGKLRLLENNSSDKVDGKWRMLSFDVPEKHRVLRNAFRRTIKRIGFKQVQRSLWACPFVKADEVQLAIEEYKLEEFVAYLVVQKTDIDEHLHNLFFKELDPINRPE